MAYRVEIRNSDFRPLSNRCYLYKAAIDTRDIDLAKEAALADFRSRFSYVNEHEFIITISEID